MARRYFNWKLAIVSLVVLVALGVSAYLLHGWQKIWRARNALPLGEQAYAEGRWEQAADLFGRYLDMNGQDTAVRMKYADAHLHIRPLGANNVLRASEAYASVLRLDGGNEEAAKRLVELDLRPDVQHYADANERVVEYLKVKKDDPELRRLRGVALADLGKYKDAVAVLEQLLRDHPDVVRAYEVMGQVAERSPKDVNQPAAYWFDEAIKQNPNSALACLIRASFRMVNRGSNDPNAAMADLQKAETLDLSDTDVHLQFVGELLMWTDSLRPVKADERGKAPAKPATISELKASLLAKANEHLDKLAAQISKNQDQAQLLWQYRAEAARQSKSADQMQQVARAGLKELGNQRLDFLPVAAELLIDAGQFKDANDCLLQMRQRALDSWRIAFLQGLLDLKCERPYRTVEQWQEALSLGYRDPSLRARLADVLIQIGEQPAAIEQLRTLVTDYTRVADPRVADPRLAGARLALAQALANAGDLAGAAEQAELILALAPRHLGAVLMELQAKMQLLAEQQAKAQAQGQASKPSAEDDNAWKNIENKLDQLDQDTKGSSQLSPQVKLLRVQAAVLQTKYAQASAILDELEKSGFNEVRVALGRAWVLAEQQKKPEAVTLLRKTMEKFPQDVNIVSTLADQLSLQDKKQECESLVKDAMAAAQRPADRRRLGLLLANIYLHWDKPEQMQLHWDKADHYQAVLSDLMTRFPDDVVVMRKRLFPDNPGSLIYNAPEAQKIVDQIKRVEGEKGWQWRYEQARVWCYSKDFKTHFSDIVQYLKQSLQAGSDQRDTRLLLARAYRMHKDLQLAVSVCREAMNLFPNDIDVMLLAVEVLKGAKETEEAQKIQNTLEKAAGLKDNQGNVALQRRVYNNQVQLGQWDSALQTLQHLTESEPNDTLNLARAGILVAQKHYGEAQTILDRLKATQSQSIEFMEVQARLYAEQGNADAALKLCDTAIKASDEAPGDATVKTRRAARAYRLRAQIYSLPLLNKLDKTIEDIQKALSLDANDAATQQMAASLLIRRDDPSLLRQAEGLLSYAVKAEPNNNPSLNDSLKYYQARLLLLKRTAPGNEQARRLLDEVTKDQPRRAEAWELLGLLEMAEGQPGRAVDVALRGLAYSPQSRRLLLLKAQGEAMRSSPALAVPTLVDLLGKDKGDPNDVEVILQLAQLYLRSEKPDKAVDLLQQHIPNLKEPARRPCEEVLAFALYKNGSKDDALARFRTLVQADPNDPDVVLMLAQVLASDKRWTELKQSVADWASRHPQDIDVPIGMSEWLAQSQAGSQAIEVAEELLRSTVQRNPRSSQALAELAILLQSTGHNPDAITNNRKSLEVDPNNTIAMNNLAWLLCEDQKQYAEALSWANKGLKSAPDYCDLIDTRGVVYYRMGSYKDAVDDLTRCIKLCPAGQPLVVQSRFHLGRVYLQMGHKTEALKELSDAMNAQDDLNKQNRPGGLSAEDQAEAKRLLDQVQKGSS